MRLAGSYGIFVAFKLMENPCRKHSNYLSVASFVAVLCVSIASLLFWAKIALGSG